MVLTKHHLSQLQVMPGQVFRDLYLRGLQEAVLNPRAKKDQEFSELWSAIKAEASRRKSTYGREFAEVK